MLETAMNQSEKRLNCIDKNLNQKRSVRVKTCADVYGHWRAYKRTYKKAPIAGVEFQIDYIDTGLALAEGIRAQAPIALALHGAPGSYQDFALLIQHLTQQKVRVIAPNFPEYVATVKTKVLFRHSADEKAAYLRDFLLAIQVTKIDLLVSHSSAIFPTLLILLNANNKAIARQQRAATCGGGDGDEADEQQQPQQKIRHSITHEDSREDSRDGSDNSATTRIDSNEQNDNSLMTTTDGNDSEVVCRKQAPTSQARRNLDVDEEEPPFEDASDRIELDGNNNNEKSVITKVDKLLTSDGHDEANNNNQRQCEAKKDSSEIYIGVTQQVTKSSLENLPEIEQTTAKQSKSKRRSLSFRRLKNNKSSDAIVKFEQPIEIRAVALLNPAGHRLPKSMRPTWFKCGSVHVYQHKFGRSLFRKFGPAVLTVVGVPVKVDNMDNVMLSATVMRNSKCHRVSKQLEQLSQMKIPTLLVFSENDKLIEKEIFHEMTQFMKLDQRNFDVFNDDGDIELSQSSMDDWIRVMVFKAGGHYAYSNYAKTVNQAVSELLEKVRTKNTSSIDNNVTN